MSWEEESGTRGRWNAKRQSSERNDGSRGLMHTFENLKEGSLKLIVLDDSILEQIHALERVRERLLNCQRFHSQSASLLPLSLPFERC
jgi:hypothetical protein